MKKILFLVGSGRLKPSPDDLRADTPQEVKDLMTACCLHDRNKRHDFVEVSRRINEKKNTTNNKNTIFMIFRTIRLIPIIIFVLLGLNLNAQVSKITTKNY